MKLSLLSIGSQGKMVEGTCGWVEILFSRKKCTNVFKKTSQSGSLFYFIVTRMLSNLKGVTGNIFTEFEYNVNVQNHEFWWVRFQNPFIKKH